MKKIIGLVFLCACISHTQSQTQKEYEIYSGLLNAKMQEYEESNKRVTSFIVLDSINLTKRENCIFDFINSLPKADNIDKKSKFYDNMKFKFIKDDDFHAMLSDLRSKITNRTKIQKDSLQVNMPIHTIENDKYYTLLKNAMGWNAFYMQHKECRNLFALSAVGHSEKYAGLYYENNIYFRSVGGFLVFLEKKEDGWKIVYTEMLWMS